jgi:hypothetical protein
MVALLAMPAYGQIQSRKTHTDDGKELTEKTLSDQDEKGSVEEPEIYTRNPSENEVTRTTNTRQSKNEIDIKTQEQIAEKQSEDNEKRKLRSNVANNRADSNYIKRKESKFRNMEKQKNIPNADSNKADPNYTRRKTQESQRMKTRTADTNHVSNKAEITYRRRNSRFKQEEMTTEIETNDENNSINKKSTPN